MSGEPLLAGVVLVVAIVASFVLLLL